MDEKTKQPIYYSTAIIQAAGSILDRLAGYFPEVYNPLFDFL